ncbi:DUF2510 domain-containing protein [Salinibacterium sp.]|uniref:DUF2510 domain-containing protein n=1 Tax=Salinibacterium sp. TaxID=1915057 RepID=UPI00286C5DA3|nr:DUF2510 domain-containing protein [Salinibacterium sp.]
MNQNEFGVSSGWYPDPLGLPQLRWWDGQGWAEHTSEARAPIVEQFATMSSAHDVDGAGLPSRRAERERQRAEFEDEFEDDFDEQPDGDVIYDLEPAPGRTDNRDDITGEDDQGDDAADPDAPDSPLIADDDFDAQGLLEMTLKEFEPPLQEDLDADVIGAWRSAASADAIGIPPAIGAVNPARLLPPNRQLRSYTISAWLLALTPLFQLGVIMLLVQVAGLGTNWPLVISAWVAPHLIALGLAAHDRLTLTLWGHRNPASPRWALLMAVSYLIVRGRRVRRETGHGSPLLLIVGLSFAALFGACIAIPGLIISVAPSFFIGEIESVVSVDAQASGAEITVACSDAPPILLGESISCAGLRADGETADIKVSLHRENGWISWRVDDWNGLLDD